MRGSYGLTRRNISIWFIAKITFSYRSFFFFVVTEFRFKLHIYICASNPTTMKYNSVVSSPLHTDLAACSGPHAEVQMVQVWCPVESMQYIFPMNFQKPVQIPNQSSAFSWSHNCQFAMLTLLPFWLAFLQFHLKRAGQLKQASIADYIFVYRHQANTRFFCLFVFDNEEHNF